MKSCETCLNSNKDAICRNCLNGNFYKPKHFLTACYECGELTTRRVFSLAAGRKIPICPNCKRYSE